MNSASIIFSTKYPELFMLKHLLHRLSVDYNVGHFFVHYYPDPTATQIFGYVKDNNDEFEITLVPYSSNAELIVSGHLAFDVDTLKMRIPEQALFYRTYRNNYHITTEHISNLISVDPFGRSHFKQDIDSSKEAEKQSEFGSLSESAHTSTFGKYAYFPFHHIYYDASEVGVGKFAKYTLDPLGFRHDPQEFTRRNLDYFTVLYYGGSAAYSINNSLGQSASKIIENNLQNYFNENAIQKTVRVINFGCPGATIYDAIAIHNLAGFRYKPDCVVAHIGFNCLLAIDQGEKALLDIGYAVGFFPRDLLRSIYKFVSGKGASYLYRLEIGKFEQYSKLFVDTVLHFHQICAGYKCRFFVGVQPSLASKGGLSAFEKSFLQNYLLVKPGKINSLTKIDQMLQFVENELKEDPTISPFLLSFSENFSNFGKEDFLFWDQCHLTGDGEKVIAAAYTSKIIQSMEGGTIG